MTAFNVGSEYGNSDTLPSRNQHFAPVHDVSTWTHRLESDFDQSLEELRRCYVCITSILSNHRYLYLKLAECEGYLARERHNSYEILRSKDMVINFFMNEGGVTEDIQGKLHSLLQRNKELEQQNRLLQDTLHYTQNEKLELMSDATETHNLLVEKDNRIAQLEADITLPKHTLTGHDRVVHDQYGERTEKRQYLMALRAAAKAKPEEPTGRRIHRADPRKLRPHSARVNQSENVRKPEDQSRQNVDHKSPATPKAMPRLITFNSDQGPVAVEK